MKEGARTAGLYDDLAAYFRILWLILIKRISLFPDIETIRHDGTRLKNLRSAKCLIMNIGNADSRLIADLRT